MARPGCSPAGLLGTLKGSVGTDTPVLAPSEDSRLRTPPEEDAREDQDRLRREAGVRGAGSGGRDALGSSAGGWVAPWVCRQDNREKTGCLARLGPALLGATGSRPLSVAAAGCSPGLGSWPWPAAEWETRVPQFPEGAAPKANGFLEKLGGFNRVFLIPGF